MLIVYQFLFQAILGDHSQFQRSHLLNSTPLTFLFLWYCYPWEADTQKLVCLSLGNLRFLRLWAIHTHSRFFVDNQKPLFVILGEIYLTDIIMTSTLPSLIPSPPLVCGALALENVLAKFWGHWFLFQENLVFNFWQKLFDHSAYRTFDFCILLKANWTRNTYWNTELRSLA